MARWKKSEIQSLLFDRDYFTKAEAKKWAKDHGYKSESVDVTEDYIRLRQADPEEFDQLRTISFNDDIKAIIGGVTNPTTEDDYVIYDNGAKIYVGDLASVAFICQSWHGGQGSDCYALSCGDYSLERLEGALAELEIAQDETYKDEDSYDEEELCELDQAIEDLNRILDKIESEENPWGGGS